MINKTLIIRDVEEEVEVEDVVEGICFPQEETPMNHGTETCHPLNSLIRVLKDQCAKKIIVENSIITSRANRVNRVQIIDLRINFGGNPDHLEI